MERELKFDPEHLHWEMPLWSIIFGQGMLIKAGQDGVTITVQFHIDDYDYQITNIKYYRDGRRFNDEGCKFVELHYEQPKWSI